MILRSPRTVRSALDVRLLAPGGSAVPVEALLRYDTSDPYAVHVAFVTGSSPADDASHPDDVVEWTFARQLLTDGVSRPSGAGDVQVWPSVVRTPNVLCLSLSSPSGAALFELPLLTVVDFLTSTYDLVPSSCEREFFDIDEALTALLTSAAED